MNIRKIIILFSLIVIFTFNLKSSFCQTSISGEQEIDELMKIAAENYDMNNQDAVILFDGVKNHWTENQRQTKFVHRIVWINSSVAIRRYADIPVEYDIERQSFHLITLRTWRDGQWWETDTQKTCG